MKALLYRLFTGVLILFLLPAGRAAAQVETDTTYSSSGSVTLEEDDYFKMAVDAYEDGQFRAALQYINAYAAQEPWHTSLGYWKVLIIDKNLRYNNISDPLFIELSEHIGKLIKEANGQPPKERNLYDEHYREVIQIDEKINFAVLKIRWSNDALYRDALKSFLKNDLGVAKLHAEKAAKTNNGSALLMLGQIAETGYTGNPRDYVAAMNYYQAAFLAGSYDAAYHIGYLYFHGYGVVKNINIAFQWCRIAAHYRYVPAMKELSNMYKHGLGVLRDQEQSRYWWDLSQIQ